MEFIADEFILNAFYRRRNPQNPHVADPNLHAMNPNAVHLPFEATPFGRFHLMNNTVATVLGLALTLLLLYMIGYRTPPYFRPYSKMLLLSAVADLIFILADFWCGARSRIANGCVLLTFTGPARYFSYHTQCISTSVLATVVMLGCTILAAQYCYRYHVLISRLPPTFCVTSLYFVVAFAVAVSGGASAYAPYCRASRDRSVDFGGMWFAEVPVPTLIVGSLTDKAMFFHISYYGLLLMTNYSLIFIMGRQTVRKLQRRSMVKPAGRSRNIQMQLTRTLIIQTAAPLATSMIPLVGALFAVAVGFDLGHAAEYVIMIVTWFPVMNSMVALVFVAPYRRQLVGWVRGKAPSSTGGGSSSVRERRLTSVT